MSEMYYLLNVNVYGEKQLPSRQHKQIQQTPIQQTNSLRLQLTLSLSFSLILHLT